MTPPVYWGDDFCGQASPPAAVNGTVNTATDLMAGQRHNCAIQAFTGSVVCWGRNSYGQATSPPSVDGTDGTAIAIAAGGRHTLAIVPEPDAALAGAASVGSLLALAHRSRSRSCSAARSASDTIERRPIA